MLRPAQLKSIHSIHSITQLINQYTEKAPDDVIIVGGFFCIQLFVNTIQIFVFVILVVKFEKLFPKRVVG